MKQKYKDNGGSTKQQHDFPETRDPDFPTVYSKQWKLYEQLFREALNVLELSEAVCSKKWKESAPVSRVMR